MLGQETTSAKRKQTDSGNLETAKRAHVDNDRSVGTSNIEEKQLQTQLEEDKSEPPRITLRKLTLPMDVWWHVFDELVNDVNALIACALVCRGWAERSGRLIGKSIYFYSPRDVWEIARLGHEGSQAVKLCRGVVIARGSLWTLGLFATTFAGKMPLLRELLVQAVSSGPSSKPEQMHVDVFNYLSSFASITRLCLELVGFPSTQTFGRLVSALPSLKHLKCRLVVCKIHNLTPGAFLRRPRNLKTLELDCLTPAFMHDVSDFLVETEMASTLKEITIRWPTEPDNLDNGKSGIPALISFAGGALHTLHLTLSLGPLPVAEGAPLVDFSKLINLKRLGFVILAPALHNQNYLPCIIPWICDRLAGFPKLSTTLRDFTLRIPLGTRPSPKDNAARHRSYVQDCKLLDDLLATPPFMGLEQFLFTIHTYELKVTDKVELERLAPVRFPKLAARSVFRVAVLDTLIDRHGIAKKRDEDGYTITDLELP